MNAIIETKKEKSLLEVSREMYHLLAKLRDYLDKETFEGCPPHWAVAAIRGVLAEAAAITSY